jgi:hypothetical protein
MKVNELTPLTARRDSEKFAQGPTTFDELVGQDPIALVSFLSRGILLPCPELK